MPAPDENLSTEKTLREIVRQLDRRDNVPWLADMKLGRPVYDHLMAIALDTKLTQNQTRNILNALFRLRTHGTSEDVMRLYMAFVEDHRIKIRSRAVVLAIGLAKLHVNYPKYGAPLTIADLTKIRSNPNSRAMRRFDQPRSCRAMIVC